ncbi:hypothetical protein [Parabacteroides sp. HGS0025]
MLVGHEEVITILHIFVPLITWVTPAVLRIYI